MYALEFEISKNLPVLVLCFALRIIMFDLTIETNKGKPLIKFFRTDKVVAERKLRALAWSEHGKL
ncbi:hypothetical protein B9Q04_20650 [Candidatus Marsarchaeota G2 archaeon BE_D]|uniref:Uncharacterized protein n=1 Tax=Candidatus Marsarchaeota G2 archaeon BE_D TaxID=1978158 RepID=A0A2R6BSI2_9ARCH|nr:MAG: hypothetical protein B9Q04_20650 [Candidatus Marsarchaeota G2 archaeon BE_D]